MNALLLTADDSNDYSEKPSTVTREMMRKRAIELAMNDGRSALEASKSDWEQAKRELAGSDEQMLS